MRYNFRISGGLAAIVFILSMMSLGSCIRPDPIPNDATLAKDTVDYLNTGQFLAVSTEGEWSISVYSLSNLTDTCDWVVVTPSSGAGTKNNIMISYSQNTQDSFREAYIIISFTEGTSLTRRLVQMGSTETGGGGSEEEDTPSELTSDPVRSWMELPTVTTTEKTAYISHHTTIDSKNVRNYSMLYDSQNRLALWVAYPLCSMYMGSQKRTDAWGFDPKIPADVQPVIFRAFGANGYIGYERGHQLPSASRTAGYSVNASTFYFSNMTAQNSALNQGLWARLENKVRGYALACDTLYVVTGAVIKTIDDPEISYIQDNNGNDVAIPKGYFKVLLKYIKKTDTYSCITFYLDNKTYSDVDPTYSIAQTLSWMEHKTGYSFFSNLPENVKSSISGTFKPNDWGL